MNQTTEKPNDELTNPSEPDVHKASEIPPTTRAILQPRWLILSLLLIVIGLGGGWYWLRLGAAKGAPNVNSAAEALASLKTVIPPDIVVVEEQELKQITVEAVSEKTIAIEQETTGKVAFNEDRMTPVFTPYAGRVVEVLANKGAVVRAGQPLLIVEAPDYVTAQNDLAAAHVEVDKGKIAVHAAQDIVERLRLLHQREAISTKDLQVAEVDLTRAQKELERDAAAVAVAKNKLILFGKEASEIDDLEKHLPEKLERRIVIRAPMGGTIVERKVGPGEYIKPDMPDPLFLLTDLSTLWVMADVQESFLPHIRIGLPVQISTAAAPERFFPAHISFINATVDSVTRTVHVRCVVPNRNNTLKPDMFAKIKIGAAAPTPMSAVPASAVIAQNNRNYVLVEQSRTRFRRCLVKTGRDIEGFTTITEGVTPGERVVTRGVLLLNNGVGKAPEKEAE